MIKFIKMFMYNWQDYPNFKRYSDSLPKDLKIKLAISDKAKGIKPYKNRLDYAFRNAVIECKG